MEAKWPCCLNPRIRRFPTGSAGVGWREASEPPVRCRHNTTEQWRACAVRPWPDLAPENKWTSRDEHSQLRLHIYWWNVLLYLQGRNVCAAGSGGRGVSTRLPLQEEAPGVRRLASQASTSHIEAYDDNNIDLHVVSLHPRASEGKPVCYCSSSRSWAEFLLTEGPSSSSSQFIYRGNLGKSST